MSRPSKLARNIEMSSTFHQRRITIVPSTLCHQVFDSLISLSATVEVDGKCREAAKRFAEAEAWDMKEKVLRNYFASALRKVLDSSVVEVHTEEELTNQEGTVKAYADVAVCAFDSAKVVCEAKCYTGSGSPVAQALGAVRYAVLPGYASPVIAVAIHQSMDVEVFGVCPVYFGTDDEKLATAKVFPSLNLRDDDLEESFAKFLAWLAAAIPRLSSVELDDKISLPRPLTTKTVGKITFVRHIRNATFEVVKENGEHIVAKFILSKRQYGKEVQDFCSEKNFAPRFIHSEIVPSKIKGRSRRSVKMIFMEFVPNTPITEFAAAATSVEKKKLYDQLKSILDTLHSNSMVHGDLHLRNVLVHTSDHTPFLVDFDFSGKTGEEGRYSPFLRESDEWHPRVRRAKQKCPLHPDHDTYLFNKVIAPKLK